MEYLELLRQINYGYDPATARLQRVLEMPLTSSPKRRSISQLTPPRALLFRRVIEEASQSIIDIAHELPSFSERTFAELIRQNRVLVEAADRTFQGLERIRSQAQADQEAEAARREV